MKPPPRKRTVPDRNLAPEPQSSDKLACKWQRGEQRKLLGALKRLGRSTGGHGDIDYAFLRKYVPTRSVSEIHSVVESLKNKVIACASLKLKTKRWEERKARKPIEVWTHMASAVAGTLEEPMSAAFSQMLIVASTEPRTLMNCDPPQLHRPPADEDRPVGRTVPLRPMPHLPVQGGTNTAHPPLVLKTPAPAMGPTKRLSAPSQVVRVPNSTIPPPQQQLSTTAGTSPAAPSCQPGAAETLVAPSTSPQTVTPVTGQVTPSSISAVVVKTQSVGSSVIQTTQQPSEQHTTTTTTSTSESTSSSPHTPLSSSSATSVSVVPTTAPPASASHSSATSSSSSTHSTPPLSTPAAAFHARFGRTSKYATKDSPRMLGVKCVVDFERIYRYLSVIHKPTEECHLTPMESAIVLDLLMSLPEELPLLDCNKLHKHLVQAYQCLSSPADSKVAREMFKDLKDGFAARTEAPGGGQGAAGTPDADGGGNRRLPGEAERQSPGSNNASSQSEEADVMGLCPPLNPFMVPLKLLRRKV
ncbi:snRNA-activating protein complex subunit 2 [Enoplosus armatus]|uniref:snRNA-activating protein complex subunit 2 n=1 Tax=Enoplosus armatus TaxID=215367 RepID=UPI0039954249